MYDAATAVHIIEPEQDLFSDLFHQGHGDPFVLMSFDETEEVLTQHLEDHTDVCAIRTLVFEVIKERYDVRSAWMSVRRGQWRVWVVLRRFYGWSGRGDQPL